MAAIPLTEEEYQFLVTTEKDYLARAKDTNASDRFSTHLRAVAKMHSDFLAREEGKRASAQKRSAAKAEREALVLQRRQERFAAQQQKMQEQEKARAQQGQQSQQKNQPSDKGRER